MSGNGTLSPLGLLLIPALLIAGSPLITAAGAAITELTDLHREIQGDAALLGAAAYLTGRTAEELVALDAETIHGVRVTIQPEGDGRFRATLKSGDRRRLQLVLLPVSGERP